MGVPYSSLVGPTCTDGEVSTTTTTPVTANVKKMWVLVKRPSTSALIDREPLTEEGAEVREHEDEDMDEDDDDNFDRIDSRDEENMEEEEGYSPSDAGQTQTQRGTSSSSLSPMGVFKAVRDTKVRSLIAPFILSPPTPTLSVCLTAIFVYPILSYPFLCHAYS